MSWQEAAIRLLVAALCVEAIVAVLIIGWFSFAFLWTKYEAAAPVPDTEETDR